MPRAAADADIFTVIAEPRRREIVEVLAREGPREVGELVAGLGLPQPAVSKHLAVLRGVGVVSVARRGRHRVYTLNAGELKTVHDWTKAFERFWVHQGDRIKERAERMAAERRAKQRTKSKEK